MSGTENANKSTVEIIVCATLEFRRAGGPTVEQGYGGKSRTVEIAENKVDVLRKAVGPKYIVEPNSTLSIDI